jgi:tRNA threonylcarbamoyladenosine biosynthesis protein TsaE
MTCFLTKSERETFQIGQKIAKRLKGGEVIALSGQLGAGKTVLIKGIASGFGLDETKVNSPTFVIFKIYPLKNKKFNLKFFCHIDAYRLQTGKGLIDIGIDDWLQKPDTVTVVEWGERVKKILPKDSIWIKFYYQKKENQRKIKIDSLI